jgi:hypothetical protein
VSALLLAAATVPLRVPPNKIPGFIFTGVLCLSFATWAVIIGWKAYHARDQKQTLHGGAWGVTGHWTAAQYAPPAPVVLTAQVPSPVPPRAAPPSTTAPAIRPAPPPAPASAPVSAPPPAAAAPAEEHYSPLPQYPPAPPSVPPAPNQP